MSADEQKPASVVAADATDAVVVAADPERSEKILKAKELYSHGSRNFLVKSYAEAADELSQVCGLYEELYGELSDELGMPYLLYAKSLIALALDENKVIDVPDEEDDDDDDDDGDDDEMEAEDGDNVAEGSGSANGEAAAKPTNGSAAKLETIKESESAASKKTAEDEADSTEDGEAASALAAGDKVSSANAGRDVVAEKTDEAMVSSTAEDGAAAKPSNGNANANANGAAATDAEKPSTSNGDAGEEEEDENEAASSLQLAWEILELAAKIFSRQGLSGLPNLAEVQTELANIEFENNILDSAREDYEKALKIYGELPTKYRRAMAEIHYKIGLTYLMQQLNKEGAASLKEACNLIESEIAEMQAKADQTEKDKNNIQDMEETKQEIWAKIAEIEEMQAQQLAEVRAALDNFIKPAGSEGADGAGPSSSSSTLKSPSAGASSSSSAAITSSSKPTDISHLIKRKKPEERNSEAEAAASPAKRPAV